MSELHDKARELAEGYERCRGRSDRAAIIRGLLAENELLTYRGDVLATTIRDLRDTVTYLGDSKVAKDAARYRWLCSALHSAKAGGGLEINAAFQLYEQPVSGEEVRIYWYPNTPVGFIDIRAETLDEAIDAAMLAAAP